MGATTQQKNPQSFSTRSVPNPRSGTYWLVLWLNLAWSTCSLRCCWLLLQPHPARRDPHLVLDLFVPVDATAWPGPAPILPLVLPSGRCGLMGKLLVFPYWAYSSPRSHVCQQGQWPCLTWSVLSLGPGMCQWALQPAPQP